MTRSFIPFLFALAATACLHSAADPDVLVPIYESPCGIVAGASCAAQPDPNGSFVDAWRALPCESVCAALESSSIGCSGTHPVVACEPMHVAIGDDWYRGNVVVSCSFGDEGYC